VLRPDAARDQLEQWVDSGDGKERFLPRIAKLPKALRRIGYGLLSCTADGEDRSSTDDWKERDRLRNQAGFELDALSVDQRTELLRLFFADLADDVELGWQFLKTCPYLEFKPFRAPRNPEITLPRRVDWLGHFLHVAGRLKSGALTASWLATWAGYLASIEADRPDPIGQLLAATIDAAGPRGEEVLQILMQSARGEHEIGAMGQHVIRALLSASRPECWELIERMLLSAGRQEGLRQSILETAVEAHPQAFRRVLRVILDKDLTRFSSVVRALDVWLGFAWASVAARRVNQTIEKVLDLLDDQSKRQRALVGKDPEDIFIALWATAYEDATLALAAAEKLLDRSRVEDRFVAVLHLVQLNFPAARRLRLSAQNDEDLRVAHCAVAGLATIDEDEPADLGEIEDLFEGLETLYARLPAKPVTLKSLVWPWTARRTSRKAIATMMQDAIGSRPPTRLIPYLSDMAPWERVQAVERLAEQKTLDKKARAALFDLAAESSSDVRQAAFAALGGTPLQTGEAEKLEGYLNRKSGDLRRGAILLLAAQQDTHALASADRLLSDGDAGRRRAGLEILRLLAEQGREAKACQSRAEAYRSARANLTKEELDHLAAIAAAGSPDTTASHALGLLDRRQRSPILSPRTYKVPFITAAAVACLRSLDRFIHEHREDTVALETEEGIENKLLGTMDCCRHSVDWSKSEAVTNLPFRELGEHWLDQRQKDLKDADGLELVRALAWQNVSEFNWEDWRSWSRRGHAQREIVSVLSGGQKPVAVRYHNQVQMFLYDIIYTNPAPGTLDYLLDALETALALVPQKMIAELANLVVEMDPVFCHMEDYDQDWRLSDPYRFWIDFVQEAFHSCAFKPAPQQWARYWQLMRWYDEPSPGVPRCRRFKVELLFEAYAAGAATLADWYDQLLTHDPESAMIASRYWTLGEVTSRHFQRKHDAYFKRFPEIAVLFDRCRDRILQIELVRGEAPTPATGPADELKSLHGTDTLIRILSALGRQEFKIESPPLKKVGRSPTFTHLVSITYPKTTDTAATFAARMRAAVDADQFPQERVLELAFLAPQWAPFCEAFLGWQGLTEGIYWFLAHMKQLSTDLTERAAVSAGLESQVDAEVWRQPTAWDRLIMERTPLTADERSIGAVDVAWFQRTYGQLTPKCWQAMAEAAQYASSVTEARPARFLADVLLGRVPIKELIEGIRTKKLKEHVRLLGLAPLATGQGRDADIGERYRILQEYRHYARQLSTMSREPALRAVDVGMSNLARTAGYPDPLRLEWALEAESVKDLAHGPVTAFKDGVTVRLALGPAGQPEMTVCRGDKELKSIPPPLKKDKKIAELTERAGELRRQSSRMKQSLESAMCRGDAFSAHELSELSHNALLAPLLERLILIGEGILGYPDKEGKALRDHREKLQPMKKNESFRIAHPHDLRESGAWDVWQRECFHAERVQPFKQVFRELYVITPQERSDGVLSRRYAGHQVQDRKAMALLAQRRWVTQDDVWKTFPDVGIRASLTFNLGVGTPLEVEGLTLDAVLFHRRAAPEPMKLTDVPRCVFSEVMRDIDLVVSIAHIGGVDPEASASTVEMRGSLLREACRFLRLDNVRFKDSHVLISGALGEYSVHLGSGTVHRMPGGALCLVPVHSQHRGRLFLPFADDDPGTAEVISKALLLARDAEIQDPTIIEQLRQ
jgi:hypothetical protein